MTLAPRRASAALAFVAGSVLAAATAHADTNPLVISLDQPSYEPVEPFVLSIAGAPGTLGVLLIDLDDGPTFFPGIGSIDIGFTNAFVMLTLPPVPASGAIHLGCDILCGSPFLGVPVYLQAVSVDPFTLEACPSNSLAILSGDTYGICGDCAPCEGGVLSLAMRYLGSSAAHVQVVKDVLGSDAYFDGIVQPQGVFEFSGPIGPDGQEELPKDISFFVDGVLNATVHTSCSQPIGAGLVFGDFRVLSSTSLDNGLICPDSGNVDCTDGKPVKLLMQYTGEDCDASSNSQSSAVFFCSGDPAFADPVHIVASAGSSTLFDGVVALGGTFAVEDGGSPLTADTTIHVFDLSGNLLQTVTFHTSCSEPLGEGDQFGSLLVVEFTPEG